MTLVLLISSSSIMLISINGKDVTETGDRERRKKEGKGLEGKNW